MATTLPRLRGSNDPPTSALPALPLPKSRKSTGGIGSPSRTPRSGLRTPSAASFHGGPPLSPAPTVALPKPRGAGVNSAGRSIRKTVSINSFPQPPSRSGSMPPSPLSGTVTPARRARTPQLTSKNGFQSSVTPSLLNGGGEGKSLLGGAGTRHSDGVISIASPPQSRSSSAQGSCSTSATTYDDPSESNGTGLREKRASKGLDGKGNVLVSVRVRPDAGGSTGQTEGEWMVDGRKSLVAYRGREGGDYYYDNVFTTHDDNSRVYDHSAKRLVRRVMEGYHGTVFAYGMTGTGKTFSMQGTASSPGVIPLAITDIFSYIRETPTREFLLRVSYLEIYNERIHDLLSMPTANATGAGNAQEEIKLREDSKRGVYATPLKEEIVQSPTQLLRVIARGDQARRTASTQFNARSSRSHAVVQIVVESRERIPGGSGGDGKRSGLFPGGVRVSTLSLIDLAGSEKAAETKERRQEGSHINKSLLTLGTVISKLSENKEKESKGGDKDGKHLPYRDSKLTRLLQGALSGNSLVSILCTIQTGSAGSTASANSHATETLNTLKFASRAKNSIVSHAKRAEEALGAGGEGGARVLLERYRMEILELRQQLDTQAKTGNNKSEDPENEKDVEEELAREKEAEARHEEQILEMQLARTALKERIDHLNRLILSSKSTGVNSNGTYSALGIHNRFSQSSIRTSITTPSVLERTASRGSSASTIGRRSINARHSSGEEATVNEEDDSLGEYGDGIASLQAQNQALQADLVDKNRYITTLEKRLLQARRASSSRTSAGFSASNKGIMVGEDHSVSALLKDKDAEIAELRARLDDKDKMLAALRSAARSRDAAEGLETLRSEARTSLLLESVSPPPQDALPDPPMAKNKGYSPVRKRSVDEMSKMLDEMIQDRVESGQLVRGVRGSVRLAQDRRTISAIDLSQPGLELPRNDQPAGGEAQPVAQEA
ncbi:kinesin-domain-containing protein [Hypoxylon argillaceum]|nr:kinesin-domain-containing protein [Hypoxylon argillaceum]KAI1156131.1 kinesin-domain-containing protein [Nemania diffusa]